MSALSRKRGRIAVAAAVLALMAPAASHAITNGSPTTGHTNVGSFVVEVPGADGGTDYLQLCTGTVVSPRVVLTASHCMDRNGYPDEWGEVWFTLAQRIGDGDSWTLFDDLPLLTGDPVPHPDYTGRANYRNDVGAFVLDAPVSGPFAELAPVGYLTQKSLRGTPFTTVGYGIERDGNRTSTQAFRPPKERMLATQPLVNVHRDYVLFSMNLARGFGGTCYGDSGGPHFSTAGKVVAVTTTGDIPCKSSDQATRTDTAYAHEFIAGLVTRYR